MGGHWRSSGRAEFEPSLRLPVLPGGGVWGQKPWAQGPPVGNPTRSARKPLLAAWVGRSLTSQLREACELRGKGIPWGRGSKNKWVPQERRSHHRASCPPSWPRSPSSLAHPGRPGLQPGYTAPSVPRDRVSGGRCSPEKAETPPLQAGTLLPEPLIPASFLPLQQDRHPFVSAPTTWVVWEQDGHPEGGAACKPRRPGPGLEPSQLQVLPPAPAKACADPPQHTWWVFIKLPC